MISFKEQATYCDWAVSVFRVRKSYIWNPLTDLLSRCMLYFIFMHFSSLGKSNSGTSKNHHSLQPHQEQLFLWDKTTSTHSINREALGWLAQWKVSLLLNKTNRLKLFRFLTFILGRGLPPHQDVFNKDSRPEVHSFPLSFLSHLT